MDANPPGLHAAVRSLATHMDACARASHEDASRAVGLKTSDHESDGRPTDDCAICAVMAQASALVLATPPYLLGVQPPSSVYLTDAEFILLNSARIVFRPRAPPIS